MQCQEVQELLSAYLDGMLDPSEREAAGRHLEQCPACRSELEELKTVVDLVRDLPPVDPPAGFRQELRRKLERKTGPVRKAGFLAELTGGRWPRILAVAASFLLVVGLAADWNGVPGKYGVPDLGARVDSYTVNENIAREGSYSGSGEARVFSVELSGYGASGPVQPGIASGEAGPARKVQAERDLAAASSASPAPLKGNAEVSDESLQARKIAAGNGVSGMAARSVAAVPPAVWPDRQVQAAVEVEVEDKTRAVQEVISIAQKLGGTAAVPPVGDGGEVIMTVPKDHFEEALEEIGKTGKIMSANRLQDEKVDLLKFTAKITETASPGTPANDKSGLGGGGTAGTLPPGSVTPVREPEESRTEINGVKKEQPLTAENDPAAESTPATATIRVRLKLR